MRHRIAMLAALSLVPAAVAIHAQQLEPGVQTSTAAAPVQRTQPPAAAPQRPKQKPPSTRGSRAARSSRVNLPSAREI